MSKPSGRFFQILLPSQKTSTFRKLFIIVPNKILLRFRVLQRFFWGSTKISAGFCKGFAKLCKVLKDFERFCKVLQGSARFFKVLQGSARFCKVLQGSSRFCKVLQGSERFWKVLKGFLIRYFKIMQVFANDLQGPARFHYFSWHFDEHFYWVLHTYYFELSSNSLILLLLHWSSWPEVLKRMEQ